MSQLQVDSISSMGGGHVDGAGKVVQFKEAVNTTQTTVSTSATTTVTTLNFTPKLSDSLILVQAFHSQDAAVAAASRGSSYLYVGATSVGITGPIGYNITKSADSRFTYGYSGSISSWGTTSKAIDLKMSAGGGNWIVSKDGFKTSLLVWEIAQ